MADSKVLGGVAIIDFGSQYTQLIARRVRELGVYSQLFDCDDDVSLIKAFNPSGIILSGGPDSSIQATTPSVREELFNLGIPVLGICYGMQSMAQQLGGQVESDHVSEYGPALLQVEQASPLLAGIVDDAGNDMRSFDVWMSHGDRVTELPAGFSCVASTESVPIAVMSDQSRNLYGVQYHPEVTHTPMGRAMLSNFLINICQCETTWRPDAIAQSAIADIKQQVGEDEVLVGLSGGVDSAVVAALIHQAIGDRLLCVFVDNGMLRLHEGDEVMQTFAEHLGVRVVRVDAAQQFYTALEGVTDPEQKRKVAGEVFIRVFEEQAARHQDIKWLGQGTIYPDVIESAKAKSGKTHVIKSHHNVGGLPNDMAFKLIEPLRDCFKDEVREVGLSLGLPRQLVYRHPFPGPGLCVRILGEVTAQKVKILQAADDIYIRALREANLYDEVAQAMAVFLPVKSVGVKGDQRCYDYVIALRAVCTTDFMTAEYAPLPHDFLAKVSNQIINEVPQVARVVYDISSKPPATIEWE